MTPPEPPAVDRSAGMTVYASRAPRVLGRIRAQKEDFQVDEIFDLGLIEPSRGHGYVPVYSLMKSGLDTPHAARELEGALKSRVNFAGLKDSNATTTQYVSARSSRSDDPERVSGAGFQALRVGYLPRPVSRGMISGNAFRIVIRTEADISDPVSEVFDLCSKRRVPNFFGYQRFGLRSMVNHKIGKSLIKRDFKSAVETLVGEPRIAEANPAAEARRLFREGRYREAQGLFSARQDIESRITAYLSEKPADYFGAFRRIPILPRRLFVHAYQAYLFNLALSAAVHDGLDISAAAQGDNWAEVSQDGLRVGKTHGVKENVVSGALPLVQLVGYAFRDYGSRFDRRIVATLNEEDVSPRSFYVKEAEEISAEGGFRVAPLLATELRSAPLLEGGGVRLTFNLGRGEYATTLLRELLKPEDPLLSGF